MPVTVKKNTVILDRIIAELPGNTDAFVGAMAEETVNVAKTSFGSGPPGSSYKRGDVVHVASSPNFPPNIDIGNLIGSLRPVKVKHNHWRAQDGVEYGIWMEDGTEDIAPRLFMRPAAEQVRRALPGEARRRLRIV